jgi:hypothetical protein
MSGKHSRIGSSNAMPKLGSKYRRSKSNKKKYFKKKKIPMGIEATQAGNEKVNRRLNNGKEST